MLIHGKKLSELDVKDLQSLIDDHVAEGKSIEYKRELPGKSDGAKKEFLADVSSFSNASGGWIFYGISEKKGFPQELVGLDSIDEDAEILRFENLLRTSIAPRLPGVSIRSISGGIKGPIITIQISKSWTSPHMVTLARGSKFYSRNSAGKYSLDVNELRLAFNSTSVNLDRLRNFRIDRIAKIIANEGPVQLEKETKAILHLIPIDAFDAGIKYDLIELQLNPARDNLAPLDTDHCCNFRFNFDGILTEEKMGEFDQAVNYLQVFRNGMIEAVSTSLFKDNKQGLYIPSTAFEKELVRSLGKYLKVQNALGIEPPFFVLISIVGVKGYNFPSNKHFPNIIDRNDLLLSETLIEDSSTPPEIILKSAFDSIWNAAGQPRSPNYDDEGNWKLKNKI